MSSMTDKMSKAPRSSAKDVSAAVPKQGDHFRCLQCGMELEITTACTCKDPEHVRFQCCGQAMEKVQRARPIIKPAAE
jgi:hypothetical protein